LGNSPSRLTATAPSKKEPARARKTKAALLEEGGTAEAVPEGVY